jgi:hypothetical protein
MYCMMGTISKALFYLPRRFPKNGTHGVLKYVGGDSEHRLCIYPAHVRNVVEVNVKRLTKKIST